MSLPLFTPPASPALFLLPTWAPAGLRICWVAGKQCPLAPYPEIQLEGLAWSEWLSRHLASALREWSCDPNPDAWLRVHARAVEAIASGTTRLAHRSFDRTSLIGVAQLSVNALLTLDLVAATLLQPGQGERRMVIDIALAGVAELPSEPAPAHLCPAPALRPEYCTFASSRNTFQDHHLANVFRISKAALRPLRHAAKTRLRNTLTTANPTYFRSRPTLSRC